MAQNKSRFFKISGRLGLKARIDLLQSSLAVWPRRGKRLLEINCGEGYFLPVLWECGFDVTATERDPRLMESALKRVGTRVEVLASSGGNLPFEDDAFDWVVLHVATDGRADLEDSLEEAMRVATGGLAVTFWNSASWPYMVHKLKNGKFWPHPRYNCLDMWHRLKKYGLGNLNSLSALSGPVRFWNRERPGFFGQMTKHVLPFGAWCIIRADIAPSRTMTFLPLRFDKAACPVGACVGMSLGSQRRAERCKVERLRG
jgi:hypothetical protein